MDKRMDNEITDDRVSLRATTVTSPNGHRRRGDMWSPAHTGRARLINNESIYSPRQSVVFRDNIHPGIPTSWTNDFVESTYNIQYNLYIPNKTSPRVHIATFSGSLITYLYIIYERQREACCWTLYNQSTIGHVSDPTTRNVSRGRIHNSKAFTRKLRRSESPINSRLVYGVLCITVKRTIWFPIAAQKDSHQSLQNTPSTPGSMDGDSQTDRWIDRTIAFIMYVPAVERRDVNGRPATPTNATLYAAAQITPSAHIFYRSAHSYVLALTRSRGDDAAT
ncbi:hypothetical protein CBL_05512 [Carabus blaptoides fortunei]